MLLRARQATHDRDSKWLAGSPCAHLKDVDGGLVNCTHHCAASVDCVADCTKHISSQFGQVTSADEGLATHLSLYSIARSHVPEHMMRL